jgi:hypothetical protein
MKRVLPALAVFALCVAAPAHAQKKIYKCTNDKGETYFANTYDPVRCAGGGSQLNAQGVAVRKFDRVKTPEELAAEKVAAAEQAEAERVAAEQKAADQVLLMSYASEQDLTRSHQQELQMIDTAIATAKLQLENQQRTLSGLLAVAAESERAKTPVPENIAKSIGTARSQIEDQNAFMLRKDAERLESAKAYEETLARYREIVARHAEH